MSTSHAMNVPLATRLDLAFQAACEIEQLLPIIVEQVEGSQVSDANIVSLTLLERMQKVAGALVDITTPGSDGQQAFDELAARLRYGHNVDPPDDGDVA